MAPAHGRSLVLGFESVREGAVLVRTGRSPLRRLVNPRNGVVGMDALPFYTLAELLGPLVEGLGFVLLPLAYELGLVNLEFLALFVLVTSGFGTLLSWYAVLGEYLTAQGYVRNADFARLMLDGLLENVGYRQW